MLTRLEQAEQKWGGIHQLLDTWLAERKTLLVQYCKLAALPPFERNDNALPESQEIKHFCQTLMDYASTGHFELYEKIQDVSSDGGKDEAQIKTLTANIKETTDAALSFNDTYAEMDEEHDMSGFVQNITELGEKLEERFELEDKLLENLKKPAL